MLFIRNFSWYRYKDRPTLEKYDVYWIIIMKGAVILHHIDVEMSKFFATCRGIPPPTPLLGHYLPVLIPWGLAPMVMKCMNKKYKLFTFVFATEPKFESKTIKVVMVECAGYATVKFSTETSECFTEFGCGTIIHTFPDGLYDVYHHDGGQIQVISDWLIDWSTLVYCANMRLTLILCMYY